MSDARAKAQEFLHNEKAFRLGQLLTESFHPKTADLSTVIQADVPTGIEQLQSVDDDIPPMADKVLAGDVVAQLVEAFYNTMCTGGRIFFTGCGSTGRLSILLEAAWRRFWRSKAQKHEEAKAMEDRCFSVMAGGDFALIKSVEGFEDFPDFGRHQLRQGGVRAGDMVVAITEGGETSFVIGTAWEGLDHGATVFFVYNNPTDSLTQHVQRSREVIAEPRITKLDLTTGPMAITGSTRMQATTAELLVVGAALETAISRWLAEHLPSATGSVPSLPEYGRLFHKLLTDLSTPQAIDTLGRVTCFEEQIYRRQGLVTYATDVSLLDVLTDTTERSPTFMVPPFRKAGDTESPLSWAFVKNPKRPTESAWRDMLQREPRGLRWDGSVYEQLSAPQAIRNDPPKLDNEEIFGFRIGNEPDPSRLNGSDSALVFVGLGPEAAALWREAPAGFRDGYAKTASVTIGPAPDSLDVDRPFHIACELPASPLRLWDHLAIKLVLNTISTATMVRLERVIGNAMVWLSPSNKKLIDRGSRLTARVTGCTYDQACEALFEGMEEATSRATAGEEPPSPVALAIERISANKGTTS